MKRLPAVAQVVAIVFWILTACYALLASQTFAYEQFLRPQLVPSIAWFARHHQVICIGLLAGTCSRTFGRGPSANRASP